MWFDGEMEVGGWRMWMMPISDIFWARQEAKKQDNPQSASSPAGHQLRKSSIEPAIDPSSYRASQPASQPAIETASYRASQLSSEPVIEPAIKPTTKPAIHTAI